MEIIGLELIAAFSRSGLTRNRCTIDMYLWVFSDAPWTISGLAQASRIDRAVIRDHRNRGLETADYQVIGRGFALTEKGQIRVMRQFRAWSRHIRPDIRAFLYRFFKETGTPSPLRAYFMFLLSLDRVARIAKMEYSYIAAYVKIEWEAGPGGVTIRQAAERTGFSYNVMHKQFSVLTKNGHIARKNGSYVMTPAGRIYSFIQFVWSWRAVTTKEWRIAQKMMNFRL